MHNHIIYVRIRLFSFSSLLYECISIRLRTRYYSISAKRWKKIKMSILYDSIIFTLIETRYSIYKKKLCALTKFVMKFDYLCKHLRHTIIVHTDHKLFIQFLQSNLYEEVYEHWTNKLKKLNMKIRYILKQKNRITNELSRIIFKTENCTTNSKMKKTGKSISKKDFRWV